MGTLSMMADPEGTRRYLADSVDILNGPDSLSQAEKEACVKYLRKLYIEPTTKCNFSCPMCARNFWDKKEFRHMTWETFTAAVDSAKTLGTVETVFFGGFGEPLSHPRIADMVQYARKAGFRPELITNGKLMDEDMILSLLDAGIKAIWVSYEGQEPDTSGHSSFGADVVYRNLQMLRHLRAAYRPQDFCELNLSCVIMKSNVDRLGSIIDTAHTLQAQNVLFSHILPYDKSCLDELCYHMVVDAGAGIKTQTRTNTRIRFPFSDFKDPALSSFLAERLLDRHPLVLGNTEISRQYNRCPFIEEGDTFVRADGEVCPCMALLHSGPVYFFQQKRHIAERSFGNVREMSLADIWNGEEYTEFRNKVINFSFSPCISCGGCDFRKKNEQDCIGNEGTTCGACFWAAGVVKCP